MDEKIEFLIVSGAVPGSRDRLSVGQVRQWLSEYLEMYEEEVGRFSELAGRPHADVLLADIDRERLALFVVAVFTDDTVTMAIGRGESSSVRGFLERESPTDAVQMIPELASRFFVAGKTIAVSRQEFSNWLKG